MNVGERGECRGEEGNVGERWERWGMSGTRRNKGEKHTFRKDDLPARYFLSSTYLVYIVFKQK